MRNTLLVANVMAMIASMDDVVVAPARSNSVTNGRSYTDPYDEVQQRETDATAMRRKEIADWNAVVEYRKAEKRARKAARRGA